MQKTIFLMGAPGAGKGTQGEVIAKETGFPHISTGDIMREIISSKTEEGAKLEGYVKQGQMVPSDLVNAIIKKFLQSKDTSYILDGYPRTEEQLIFFRDNINDNIVTFFFDIDEELAVQRIEGRYSCSGCGKIYNKFFAKPKVEDVCDQCGAKEFSYRSDDQKKIILNRLYDFQEKTVPVIEKLKDIGSFFYIDARKTSDEVRAEVHNFIKKI